MLELKNITYQPQTGNKKILNNINLKIKENEIILICGTSGSGKTTLVEIISGLISPQKGEIFWKRKVVSSRQRRWICGVVFQFPERFFIGSTIGKELKIGEKSLKNRNLESVLNKVGMANINLSMPPEKLSGGQQRRLAVAVQLLRNPSIILFDEPTAGLDWSMKNDVRDLINSLRINKTIIVVTHEAKLFQTFPSKIYNLKHGKLILKGG